MCVCSVCVCVCVYVVKRDRERERERERSVRSDFPIQSKTIHQTTKQKSDLFDNRIRGRRDMFEHVEGENIRNDAANHGE